MNIIGKHVCSRLAEIANIPAALGEACEALGDTITGVAACVLAVPTLGYSKSINAEARLVTTARFIVPNLFRKAILILNPSAKFGKDDRCVNAMHYLPFAVIINVIVWRIFGVLRSLDILDYEPQKFSRFVSAIHLSLLTITRTFDIAVGLVISSIALATFGYFDSCNEAAYVELGGFDAVIIPAILLFGVVNPGDKILMRY